MKTLFYVEDDDLSREILDMIVEDMDGYDLITFTDSSDFVSRVNQLPESVALILLDIHLKPYDGFEMLKMLRQQDRFRDVPIIALTASVMNEEVNRLKQAGFNGAIAKPVDQDNFPGLIDEVLVGKSIWSIISHIE